MLKIQGYEIKDGHLELKAQNITQIKIPLWMVHKIMQKIFDVELRNND